MSNWYQMKERAAGEKRLWLTWQVYKLLGRNAVKLIAFCVTFCTFVFAKDLRKHSRRNLEMIGIKPTLLNVFKNFYNYALTLIDKMEVYSGNFDFSRMVFASAEDEKSVTEDFESKKGIFFVCSHVGNVEVMRSFVTSREEYLNTDVCVFLSGEQCKTFNTHIKKITAQSPIKAYPVEEIDLNTSIEVKEKLDNGGIAYIAGDRVSQYNTNAIFQGKLFGKTVELPKGSLKLAQLMDVPTYFIITLATSDDKYTIYLKKVSLEGGKQEVIKRMQGEYLKFIEEVTLVDPLQFYHFYDFFK